MPNALFSRLLRHIAVAPLVRTPTATEPHPAASPRRRATRAQLLEWCAVFALGASVFCGAILWLDNVHIATTNGQWKCWDLTPWIEKQPTRQLQAANLLYFPAHGFALRKLLPESVFGPTWRRMAFLNAFYGALALVFTHVLVTGLTRSRLLGWAATLFQMGCGFFLLLSVINEDIMASYACLSGALALAVRLWDRPSIFRIALVSALFTLSWLFEWRVMFPSLPAFLLACVLLPGHLLKRIGRATAFLGTMLLIVAGTAHLVRGKYDMPASFADCYLKILWTGKGVDTGWAGFSRDKVDFLLIGMTESFLGGGNYDRLAILDDPAYRFRMRLCLSVMGLMLAAFLVQTCRNWGDPRFRVAFAALGGTFLCGQVMNLYSQPQDPQMQINPMAWMAAGWALLGSLLAVVRLRNPVGASVLLAASLAPLVFNLEQFGQFRGGDSRVLDALARLKSHVELKDTLFVSHGFEGHHAWARNVWKQPLAYPVTLDPPPRRTDYVPPGWYVISEAVHHPEQTPEQHARVVTGLIDHAFELGYRVVINRIWDDTETRFIESFSTVCGPPRPRAVHAALHAHYRASLIYVDPALGPYYELRPAAGGGAEADR